MNVGISYWFGYPSFPEERIRLLRKYGFDNVALHWTDEYIDVTGEKKDIPKILQHYGISISSFHMSYDMANLLWDDSLKGFKYREDLYRAVDDACKWNVPVIVIHTNGIINKVENLEYFFRILDVAKRNKIFMCVENLQIGDNLEKILTSDCSRDVYLCYDTGHANIRQCPFEVYNNYNIKYIHINDNDSLRDVHYIPYAGTICWESELKKLHSLNNIGAILEVHSKLENLYEAECYLNNASLYKDMLG